MKTMHSLQEHSSGNRVEHSRSPSPGPSRNQRQRVITPECDPVPSTPFPDPDPFLGEDISQDGQRTPGFHSAVCPHLCLIYYNYKSPLQHQSGGSPEPQTPPPPQDNPQPEDISENEDEQPDSPESVVEAIRIQQKYAEYLKTATLEDSPLSSEEIESLRNPLHTTLDDEIKNTPNLSLCLDLFVALEIYPDQAYTSVRSVIEKHFPDRKQLFSHYQMKNRIQWLSGVVSMATDMCPNSCMAYTGPLADRTTCLYCDAARYKLTPESKVAACDEASCVPMQQFFTVPIGPQLQALWRHPKSAKLMKYRTLRTLQVQEEINANPNGQTQSYDDIFCGSEYLQAVADGKIGENDIYLIWSCDSAQLYRNVESDCWIFI